MVADDMACNPRNPRPATVFNNEVRVLTARALASRGVLRRNIVLLVLVRYLRLMPHLFERVTLL